MLYRRILESVKIVLFSLSVTLFFEYFISLSIASVATVNSFSIDVSDSSRSECSDIRISMSAGSQLDQTIDEQETFASSMNRKMKQIYGIRHGKSVANEFMDQPGNRWGDATFYDDCTLKDATLSPTGIDQARQLAQRLLLFNETNQEQNNSNNMFLPNEIDLIIISPLSRCIQTWEYGVLPAFRDFFIIAQENTNDNKTSNNKQKMPKVLCLPILRERVYTASDTGRSLIELQKEFNTLSIDWDESITIHTNGYGTKNDKQRQQQQQQQNNGNCEDIDYTYEEIFTIDNWWYHPMKDDGSSNTKDTSQKEEEVEWRPYGNGQYYAVPGEPIHIFQNRMKLLKEFIYSRHEQRILLITHWGVLLNFTGFEVDNCSCVKLHL